MDKKANEFGTLPRKSARSKRSDSDCHSKSFTAEFMDAFSNCQHRWGRNRRIRNLGKRSSTDFKKPQRITQYFSCTKNRCSLRTCDQHRNYNLAQVNMAQWSQRKRIRNHDANIQVAECIVMSSNYEELIEILLAIVIAHEDYSEAKEDEPAGYDNSLLCSCLDKGKEEYMEHAVEANDVF